MNVLPEQSGSLDYRPLQPADLPDLQQALPQLPGGLWSASSLQALLESSIRNPLLHCRVLRAGGKGKELLGFAEFQTVVDECQLINIAIVAEHQQSGLGSALLASVLQEAHARGCEVCVLEVRASNQPALALYRSSGFTECGVRKAYYAPLEGKGPREDALLLRCDLR